MTSIMSPASLMMIKARCLRISRVLGLCCTIACSSSSPRSPRHTARSPRRRSTNDSDFPARPRSAPPPPSSRRRQCCQSSCTLRTPARPQRRAAPSLSSPSRPRRRTPHSLTRRQLVKMPACTLSCMSPALRSGIVTYSTRLICIHHTKDTQPLFLRLSLIHI